MESSSWRNTDAYKSVTNLDNQVNFYKRHNTTEEVLELVKLDSKKFGTVSENIIKEILNLGQRTNSQHDATLPATGTKIEIKTARYWSNTYDCKWQHLEPDHDYDVALMCLLDFNKWKVWAIHKDVLMGSELRGSIVKHQGKQGWWVKKSQLIPHMTRIYTAECLKRFVRL